MSDEIDDGMLIECVRDYPSIYDKNHIDFRNKLAKIAAWAHIGRRMSISEEFCEQRWNTLRNRFATELRNQKKSRPGVAWRHTEEMAFLKKYISPRKSGRMVIQKDGIIRTAPRDVLVKTEDNLMLSPTVDPLATADLRANSPSSHCVTNINNNNNNCGPTKLRPIAPRPPPTMTRLVSIQNANETPIPSVNFANHQHDDDEDILFGKSIGHTLKNIKNKKIKLQIKSEILAIMAQHAE